MPFSAAKLKKLQITLTRPVELEAYEYINDTQVIYSDIIRFPVGTVFSGLKEDTGYISGISSEIGGKRYFAYIPRAGEWTLQRDDQKFIGYYHGGKRNTRKTKKTNTRKGRTYSYRRR